jgi:3-oxosteroid 1-dehydrogenase
MDTARAKDGFPMPLTTEDAWLLARAWSTPDGFARLVQEAGAVTGAVVQHEGRDLRIHANRGVVLAGGGFARNSGWRRRYHHVASVGRPSAVPQR